MYPIDSQDQRLLTPLVALHQERQHTFFYRAYGLVIRSQLPLPEFPAIAAVGSQQASVVIADGSSWIDPVRQEQSYWSVRTQEARFWFNSVGGFRVRNGTDIIVSPEPGIDQSLLRMYVEGMMMACLLQQRGYYVLHSSVVRIGGHAVAFLGHVGAGKSSLAAALHTRGHAVVTDDNAAIEFSPEPVVIPAFPAVKVYPAIAASLGYDENSLKVMHSSQMKRAASVSRAFPESPVPLRRLYVLERGAANALTPLSPGETTVELIRNSVPTRWRQPADGAHLAQCGRLSRLIPACRLRTFDSIEQIPALVRTIEDNELERSAAAD